MIPGLRASPDISACEKRRDGELDITATEALLQDEKHLHGDEHSCCSDAALLNPQPPTTMKTICDNSQRPSNYLRHAILTFGKGLMLCLAIFGCLVIIYLVLAASRPRQVSCYCGHSTAEALQRGCKYDSMAAAWLPSECRDDALTAEFDVSGSGRNGEWQYYADYDKNRSLTLAEVSLLADVGGHFWTTHEWHIVHCAFYWRKIHRQRAKGTWVEPRYDNEMHIKHCLKTFLLRDDLQSISTGSGVALNSDVVNKHRNGQSRIYARH